MLRTVLFTTIIAVASPAGAAVPQLTPEVMLDVKCATPEERSATLHQLNSKIDWFLSRVEVPAAISKQLDNLAREGVHDPEALKNALTSVGGRACVSGQRSTPQIPASLSLDGDQPRDSPQRCDYGLCRQRHAGKPAERTRQDQSRSAHH